IRRFLEEQCPTTRVRAIMETDTAHDTELWQGLVDLGVAGLTIPAAYGGSGLGLLDLALAAEELGYGATPGPCIGLAGAAVAFLEGADAAQREQWLPRLAEGKALATVAFGEAESEWTPQKLSARVTGDKLTGIKPFVPYASAADLLVVAAHDDKGLGFWTVE